MSDNPYSAENGFGSLAVAALAAIAPPFVPPGYLAYGVWTYGDRVLGWHPLFASLLAAAALANVLAAAFFLIRILPRPLAIGVIAAYVGGCYWWAAYDWIGLDQIWSGAAAVVFGAVGIWLGMMLKDAMPGAFAGATKEPLLN